MAGTIEGARKTRAKVVAKFGEDFWKNIGSKGGKNGKTGGFASDVVGKDGLTGRQRARIAGQIGGTKSKRS